MINELKLAAAASLAAALAATSAMAGWEDTGAPPARSRSSAPVTITTSPSPAAQRSYAQPAAQSSTTVREAAQRRANARAAEARAAQARERALLDEERRRIDSRAGAYRAPQPQPQRQQRAAPAADRYGYDDYGYGGGDAFFIPFFDARRESDNWLHAIYMTPAEAANGNDLTMAEARCRILMVDARDVIGGDLALSANIKGLGFIDDAEYETLPYVLLDLDLDLSMVWRFVNDFSLEVGARPGIYGDPENFDASLFSWPLYGCLYYSFTPECAIRAGAEVRPGWDKVVIPLAGIGWAPSEYFFLDASFPCATATFHLGPLDIYGLAEWNNATYAMEDKGQKPEDLTVDFWRLGGGLTLNFFDAFRLGGEAGYILGRKFTAEGSAGSGEIKLENSPYFGATLGARF